MLESWPCIISEHVVISWVHLGNFIGKADIILIAIAIVVLLPNKAVIKRVKSWRVQKQHRRVVRLESLLDISLLNTLELSDRRDILSISVVHCVRVVDLSFLILLLLVFDMNARYRLSLIRYKCWAIHLRSLFYLTIK